ncbi:hypothetical protein SAMN04487989_104237 [Bizionia echini]|uniref:Uncharacterized protein n=1 Tax=Bizionia echini TaxID=649333 RepID=A0A1I5C7D6_9FLAO|nr:hypothetical protein [Bizionia echini]SFN82551.1 hypothetical protein SAMN04487989_104237 [Bizionia echini]
MKQYLKSLTLLSISIFFITFTACDNEPLDAGLNGADGNGNNEPSGNTTGDYWPRAEGNTWTYNALGGTEETYTIIGTEIIDGINYFEFDNLLGIPAWMRKGGANYYVRNEVYYELPGFEVQSTPFVVNMLKDDAEVGETWSSNVNYTLSFTPTDGSPGIPDTPVNALYTLEMIERDMTKTVEGIAYTNVLHVHLVVSASGQIEEADYFYAKDIGLIEYISGGGSVTLLEYTLN